MDYQTATEIVGRLAVLDKLTRDQSDYLESLSALIRTYEQSHYPAVGKADSPLEMLKFLLDENGMSGSDLGRLLGQRQLGTKILNGTRQLSKTHIKTLADHFRVNPGLFL